MEILHIWHKKIRTGRFKKINIAFCKIAPKNIFSKNLKFFVICHFFAEKFRFCGITFLGALLH